MIVDNIHDLRRWRDSAGITECIEVMWGVVDQLLIHHDHKAVPYTPETTNAMRAEILSVTEGNRVVRAMLRDLDAAEAALAGEVTAKWIRLRKPSPSGKTQWVCTRCGRMSQTPDRVCGDPVCDEVPE